LSIIYNAVFKPLEPILEEANVNSIMLSLDQGLRLFPWAALYDEVSDQFLIEKYSLAIVPSFSLTNTQISAVQNRTTLAMGAEEFLNQKPLPGARVEVETVAAETGTDVYFLDNEFTLANLETGRTELSPGIIHLATHADFNPGALSESYIQFWQDERLTLDRMRELQWFTDPVVELLVLSACETAFGNPQEELGFAGLAVNAGVRSALASLWQVSDTGTLSLMAEFYNRLEESAQMTKAEALQLAQIAMLRGEVNVDAEGILRSGERGSERGIEIPLPQPLLNQSGLDLTHPYFWASFTLIGSPW
jgi:CHAT domain-containing protein